MPRVSPLVDISILLNVSFRCGRHQRLSHLLMGFPGDSDAKESPCPAGHWGSVPVLGRYPGEGNGNPLEYSCLRSPMDRRAWRATVHGVTKLDTAERLTQHNMEEPIYIEFSFLFTRRA